MFFIITLFSLPSLDSGFHRVNTTYTSAIDFLFNFYNLLNASINTQTIRYLAQSKLIALVID